MNYDPKQFAQMQKEQLKKKKPVSRKALDKRRQRAKIRDYCLRHYQVCTSDAAIMADIREEERRNENMQ